PIFLVFLLTHAVLIGWGILAHLPQVGAAASTVHTGFQNGLLALGALGLFGRFIHAYSLGAGTYTGIEAVSNGIQMMREPRVNTAKRTMFYMASSLAITAGGLILCYLLWGVVHVEGKTMNAVLAESVSSGWVFARGFVVLTLLAEGALL